MKGKYHNSRNNYENYSSKLYISYHISEVCSKAKLINKRYDVNLQA